MPLFDLTEFFKLSSALNYNLNAASLNRSNLLMYITDNKRLDDDGNKDRDKRAIVMEALGYLFSAYRQKRRHLGPMAVLHPLRATALFTRTRSSLDLVELLTLLFHDILEDIKPGQFDVQEWKTMEGQLYGLFDRMDPEDASRHLAEPDTEREVVTAVGDLRHVVAVEAAGGVGAAVPHVAGVEKPRIGGRLDAGVVHGGAVGPVADVEVVVVVLVSHAEEERIDGDRNGRCPRSV